MSAAHARVFVVVVVVVTLVASATVRAADQLAAPQYLQAVANGSNVLITWRAGSTSAPDGYRLEAGSGSGLADLAIVHIPWGAQQGIDARFAVAGVAPGIYYLRVRPVFDGAIGAASQEITMQVGTASCQMPNAPLNVHASVASDRVTLAWEQPTAGAPATGYVIEAGNRPGAPNLAIITIDDSTTLSVQAPAGRYFVRMRAMGDCGASEPSREVEVIVP